MITNIGWHSASGAIKGSFVDCKAAPSSQWPRWKNEVLTLVKAIKVVFDAVEKDARAAERQLMRDDLRCIKTGVEAYVETVSDPQVYEFVEQMFWGRTERVVQAFGKLNQLSYTSKLIDWGGSCNCSFNI